MTISYILMFLLIIILILIICSIIVNSIQNTYDQPIKKLGGVYKNGKLNRIYKGGTIEQLMSDINDIIAQWPTLNIDTIKEKIKEKIRMAVDIEKAICKKDKTEEMEAFSELLMRRNEETVAAEHSATMNFQRLMLDYLPILSMIEDDILKKNSNSNSQYDRELSKVSELISNIRQNYDNYLDNENQELRNYIQMWVTGISDKLTNSDKLQQANDDLLQVIQVQNKIIEIQKQIFSKLQQLSTTDNDIKLLDNALSKEELDQLLQLIYRNMEDINKMKDTTHRDVKELDLALAERAMQQAVELSKGMKDIENMKEDYERIIQENSSIIHKANENIESYLQLIENLSKKHIQLGNDNTKLLQIIDEINNKLSTVVENEEQFKADVMKSAMVTFSEQNDKIHKLTHIIQQLKNDSDLHIIIQDIAHIVGIENIDDNCQNILDKIMSILDINLELDHDLKYQIEQNENLLYTNKRQERIISEKTREIAEQDKKIARRDNIIARKDEELTEQDEELAELSNIIDEQSEEIDKQNAQNSTLLKLLDTKEKSIESIKSELIKNLKSHIVEISRSKLSISKLTKENAKLTKENAILEKTQIEIILENKELSSNLYIILAKMKEMKEEYSTQIQNLTDQLLETSSQLQELSEELIAAKTKIQENEQEIADYKNAFLEEYKSVDILQDLYDKVTEKLDNFSTNSSRQISRLKQMTKKLFTRISIL